MATEYKLSYTASDINERLGKVDEIDSLKTLVGNTPVSEQISDAAQVLADRDDQYFLTLESSRVPVTRTINGKALDQDIVLTPEDIGAITETDVANQIAEAIVEVYAQDEEPIDAPEGSIWIDTDADGASTTSGKVSANVYVVDARTTDVSTVDFSQYAIGDVVIVTTS